MKSGDTFSVFILKAHASSLAQAETFLKNRKWIVASSTNLKEALAFIITKKPQYILITADHPNKKVKVLPKMLAQAFPVSVIGFSEKSSSDSSRSLTSMGLEYNLYSPVSGPAIERIILKIRKEEETKKQNTSDPNRLQTSGKSGGSASEGAITLKGGAVSEEEQRRSFEQARAALAQFVNSEGNEADFPGAAVQIQKGGNQSSYEETQGSAISAQNFEEWEQEPSLGLRRKEKSAPVMDSEYIRRKAKQARYFSDPARETEIDSVIVRGTKEALENSVTALDTDSLVEIQATSNVACITIESPRFSGYLICALAQDQKVDGDLIKMINKRLFAFLRENGEAVKDQETMEIKIQSVDFIDWSIDQAQFLKKSTHNGREIAMAFFPHKEMRKDFVVDDNKMIKLRLEEFKPDVAVEFDVFIYMPENKKFILYTPEGSKFYGKQQDRLKQKGIKHMHIRETAIGSLKKYEAQNYLNEQIEIYNKNKTISPAA